jgi:hypothetical protein
VPEILHENGMVIRTSRNSIHNFAEIQLKSDNTIKKSKEM